MQGVSDAFQAAVKGSHTAVCEVDIIQNGKVVAQLQPYDGTATADRTAAQMRSATVSFGDPTGTLTPADMSSMLAPFGTLFQPKRGVRILSTTIIQDLDNNFTTWSGGTHMGTVADVSTGVLRIGP